MPSKKLQNIGGLVILASLLAHGYCYWIFLNGGKAKAGSVNLYYVSLYSVVSVFSIVVQLVSTTMILTVAGGICLAGFNSFLLVEFLGKPEYWGLNELYMFISTVSVSFLAAIVFNELKKKLNDGSSNMG
jgi:hypothetical protein